MGLALKEHERQNAALNTQLKQRAGRQAAIDQLADLRSDGVHEILNRVVSSTTQRQALETFNEDWCRRVREHLEQNFTRADMLHFSRLGIVPIVELPHAFDDQHAKMLREFALRDERIREIIDRYSAR